MVKVALKCIHCNSKDIIKSGRNKSSTNPSGTQRYKCKNCRKSFQNDYQYLAKLPQIRNQVIEMAINSSGTRDTARVLNISKDTVTSILLKKRMK